MAGGAAALLGLSLATAFFETRPALAVVADKLKSFACNASTACLTAANAGAGPGFMSTSSSGNGVEGKTSAQTSAASGVYGESDSNGSGYGVAGRVSGNVSTHALFADGGPNGASAMVVRDDFGSPTVPMILVNNTATGSLTLSSDNEGDLSISGLLYSSGPCRNGCSKPQQRVVSYGAMETEPTAEDSGEAHLRGAESVVRIDPAFANVVDRNAGYTVLLSAEGDSAGLYVGRTKARRVRRANGGWLAGVIGLYLSYRCASVRSPRPAAAPRAEHLGRPRSDGGRVRMNGFSLASGTASLLGLALLTAMAVGDRPAVAGAKKPKTFSCSSSSACVTAANAGSGSGTFTSATSQNGLQGNTNSGQAAVYGENTASGGGNGVTGRATSNSLNDYAVFGDGGPNGGVPLLATSEYTGSDGADLIKTINDYDGSIPLYADTFGNVQILGYFYSAGACSSGCAPTRRRVISYGSRDTSPTTEDVGEAGLDGGKATIVMDSATLRGIDTEAGYEVFLTAEGDTNGLYVASKTAKAFVVRETRGGRASVPFAYRIVGRRSGLRPQRLHFVTITKNAHGAAEASQ